MGLRFLFVLTACVLALTAAGDGHAAPFGPGPASPAAGPLVRQAKIVCGDFGNGYTCKMESGTVRRSGKTPKVPGSNSGSSGGGGGWFGGGNDDPDALPESLPPDSGGAGAAPPPQQQPGTRTASCPQNSELLGGHCIPYTQRCTNSIPPSAYPPQCQGEEKQVCNFHPDGSKDCCCRVYSKY